MVWPIAVSSAIHSLLLVVHITAVFKCLCMRQKSLLSLLIFMRNYLLTPCLFSDAHELIWIDVKSRLFVPVHSRCEFVNCLFFEVRIWKFELPFNSDYCFQSAEVLTLRIVEQPHQREYRLIDMHTKTVRGCAMPQDPIITI